MDASPTTKNRWWRELEKIWSPLMEKSVRGLLLFEKHLENTWLKPRLRKNENLINPNYLGGPLMSISRWCIKYYTDNSTSNTHCSKCSSSLSHGTHRERTKVGKRWKTKIFKTHRSLSTLTMIPPGSWRSHIMMTYWKRYTMYWAVQAFGKSAYVGP